MGLTYTLVSTCDHRDTGIAEVRVPNPVEAMIFFPQAAFQLL